MTEILDKDGKPQVIGRALPLNLRGGGHGSLKISVGALSKSFTAAI